jgi:hypothetical protein
LAGDRSEADEEAGAEAGAGGEPGLRVLTRMEMDTLKLMGMTEEEAWAEARSLFCLASMAKLGL